VIDRTKEEGREIILIIDEIHHHAESDISQD
jgi:ATP-dependent Clp protease ATP-binding subunit ClpA